MAHQAYMTLGETLVTGIDPNVHLGAFLVKSGLTLLLRLQDGNPFGPFWDYVGVEFDQSILFGGISFSTYHQPQWIKK